MVLEHKDYYHFINALLSYHPKRPEGAKKS